MTQSRPHDLSSLGWVSAIDRIGDQPGVVVVLGAPDLGKTTWVTAAARQLTSAGASPTAIVDADIGQASLGPPATVALTLLTQRLGEDMSLSSLPFDALSFVGSVSPGGHLLQTIVSTHRLVTRGKGFGAKTVLVDTTGLITPGMGFQLKLRKIELLDPSHLVVFQRGTELEPLLSVLAGRSELQIHRLATSRLARHRDMAERSAYRARRFVEYFSGASRLGLSTAKVLILNCSTRRHRLESDDSPDLLCADALGAEGLAGRLIGLNNAADETVALGLFESVSEGTREILVKTPLRDASSVRILQLGNMRLDETCQEV